MKNLQKAEHDIFKNFYTGTNGDKKVNCILDSNCVRYIVFKSGKAVSKKEYSNKNKNLCFKNAEKALNN
ncbi:MAG: hypothetical protein LUD77_11850 [Clostridiales bacterium]|nr:hypothetical protein [Clostridiales bacterium]